jgi:hypothetical protein
MLSRRNLFAAVPLIARSQVRNKTKPAVALILTEYRRSSHADVIGTRLLGGYDYYGKRREPRVQAVSMFTDQTPGTDMSRDMGRKYQVPLFDTVRDALTRGGNALAVDGVVLVGEHGRYPYNEKLQHLYPRYELFRQVMEVFRSSSRSVPVFCDKHLSTDWWKAKWMYDQSRELAFPFLAGSSVPVAWRRPELELPAGAPIRRAVAAASGPTESYGFHALEMLQCMAERRRSGETGVSAVRCIEGPEVWEWTSANSWAAPLLEAAVARSETRKPGELRDNVKKPVLFVLEYKDGFQGAVYLLNGHLTDFNLACDVEGRREPAAALFWLQRERPHSHFSGLVHWIEEMIVTKKAPYPVERTLLVTGMLSALMESAWKGHVRQATPHLELSYAAPKGSFYNRGAVPPAREEI